MKVLVDTPVWSLALRRNAGHLREEEATLRRTLAKLVSEDLVVMLGPIRQELLSGIREASAFERLRDQLRAFEDERLSSQDYEAAAQAHNKCRAKGIAGSAVDFLICAVADRRGLAVFTTDRDFERYAELLPIRLVWNRPRSH